MLRVIPIVCLALASCATEQNAAEAPKQAPADAQAVTPAAQAFTITVPGTTAKLEFVPIPRDPADPASKPFFLARTETTWDMYDAFVFAMERPETEKDPPDAFARPSKPYILMDRGFGHAGYPVISVSYKGASEFCKWLAHKTGKPFRLPTESEWERAAQAGASATVPLADVAWFKDNSELDMRVTTHPIATRQPDALGLYDVLGNAAEWTTSSTGKGVARGGSFREPADLVTPTATRADDKSLNRTDPQIPKSVWWLADGGFIGFRVLCEPE
jgi:formylglycine-generating enzyme required for sulfatase activity